MVFFNFKLLDDGVLATLIINKLGAGGRFVLGSAFAGCFCLIVISIAAYRNRFSAF
jgi:hypothetical protein